MRSLWQSEVQLPEFPKLKGNIKTDVLIIGGGIAGILCAYFLTQSGADCIVAERKRICGGTTGNTTAKITFQHGLIYSKILKSQGAEKARMYLEANRNALRDYAELCKSIDCDFEIKDNFVYTINNEAALENEMRVLQKIGYNAVFYREIPLPFETSGAVMFPEQAQFNPLKFILKISEGLNIFENTHIKSVRGNTALTDEAVISAEKIIVAAHFPFINSHGSYFLKLYQHRSYVIALENAENVGGMYVDNEKTGMSFRNYGDLLLIGGGGHRTGKRGGNWDELRAFAKKHYPSSKEAATWAAQDCMSLDGIPYIGNYSALTPSLFAASGFNKWGMTSSMVAARLLCDLVLGRKNDLAELFSPSRSILKPQLAVNGFEAAAGLLSLSARRCPHMCCRLKWNNSEHSWDCSCHGSRFDENGGLIDNPANKDLEQRRV